MTLSICFKLYLKSDFNANKIRKVTYKYVVRREKNDCLLNEFCGFARN